MAEPEVIDRSAWNRLLESVGDDREFMAELLTDFFADAPVQMSAMRQALATGAAEELRRAAHTLKSTSANFGAAALSAGCKELERMAKEGRLESAARQLSQVVCEYELAREALKTMK